MATAGEILVDYSTLSGVHTAATHFLNIDTGGLGGIVIVNRFAPFYKVAYVPSEAGAIKYVRPSKQKITYVESPKVMVTYIPLPDSAVKYIRNEPIKITYKCKP